MELEHPENKTSFIRLSTLPLTWNWSTPHREPYVMNMLVSSTNIEK